MSDFYKFDYFFILPDHLLDIVPKMSGNMVNGPVEEVSHWIRDNVPHGQWFCDTSIVYFRSEEDAIAFKLRWLCA